MRFDGMKRRLGKLEHGRASADAILRFADESIRGVSVRHPLELFCAACARLCFFLGPSEGARPASPYDELIDLFGRATDIQTDDKFLLTILGVYRQCIEEAPKNLQ
jgi:hypothetical protein